MRFLFLMTHAGLFRLFESTLRELLERGHEVHIAFDSERYPSDALAALEASSPGLTTSLGPPVLEERWTALGRQLRGASDYFRYLAPAYAGASKLRERARKGVPLWLRPVARPGRLGGRVDGALRWVEARLPLSGATVELLRARAPDVLVVSSLFGSVSQLEGLRAARALGLPAVFAVASWDNLTNKGLIRALPDRVLVWNDAQEREAVELHGVPPERVTVTGAPSFDGWFGRAPSRDRAAFTARMGLPAERPFVLYAGSSSFIAPEEATFAAEWLARLRADERLRDLGVLLRPHPQNARGWDDPALAGAEHVAVWPPPGLAPQQTGRADWSREDFYDSMYHAAAVVGVNTTAMIDSAVLGKAVHTILAPRFRDTQAGTLHFEHLRSAGGGLLHAAPTWDAHLDALAASLAADGAPDPRAQRFVQAFIRPHGLARPATPLVADALEAAASEPTASRPLRRRGPLVAEPLALVAATYERVIPRVPRLRQWRRRQAKRWRKRLGLPRA